MPLVWRPMYDMLAYPWPPGESREFGAVGYNFEMGKFEVSEGMVDKAKAAGATGIQTISNRGVNKPATNVTWQDAAHFVNWLNTSTGFPAAYKFGRFDTTLNCGKREIPATIRPTGSATAWRSLYSRVPTSITRRRITIRLLGRISITPRVATPLPIPWRSVRRPAQPFMASPPNRARPTSCSPAA